MFSYESTSKYLASGTRVLTISSVNNYPVLDALPEAIDWQLRALNGDPELEYLLLAANTPHQYISVSGKQILWILAETGEELTVRKYLASISYIISRPDLKVPVTKKFCLVASGPSLSGPTLLRVKAWV